MFPLTRRWLAFGFLALASAPVRAVGGQSTCATELRTLERRDVPPLNASREMSASLLADVVQCSTNTLHKTWVLQPLTPRLRIFGSRGLPAAHDDGELWVGRGVSVALRAGFTVDGKFLHVAVAPELVSTENTAFDHEPARDTARSSFASPFYSLPSQSIDLPTQFGVGSEMRITPGASAIWLSGFGVAGGISTSLQAWGPGLRGSLLLGASAGGIPRAFLRSANPMRTRIGVFDAVLFLGTVTESRYFDRDTSNNYRSMSAFGLTWSPDSAGLLALGAARGVMHTSDRALPEISRSIDALRSTDTAADDLISMFAKLGRPSDALSAWVEVARNRKGFGSRSFLTLPYDATGYIIGARGSTGLRGQQLVVLAEAANLEQSEDVIGRAPKDFYAGTNVPQGWTQRGRPIGHWVGPGGQTQFISIDWVRGRSRVGLYAERVRRNEDALFREYLAYPNRHDVSLEPGIRAALAWRGQEFALDVSNGKRLNFEFQNATYLPSTRTVDVVMPRISFSVTPLSQR
ncbi:MAG: capsule assembly Wzi family protein [Gemmatimonas sp.]